MAAINFFPSVRLVRARPLDRGLPTLFDRQRQCLLCDAAKSIDDLEGKIRVAHGERGSADPAGSGIEGQS
jgi:hypothetical protein